jgi:Abnormal spindle-like microcephaly-assoc'd, ASPM-SPD-2-Hydin
MSCWFRPCLTIVFVCLLLLSVAPGQTASLSTTSLNFGNQAFGVTSAPLSVTVTNTGSVNLTFSSISVVGANRPDWAPLSGNCAGNIKPGNACTITAKFTPQATGARSATIQIADNAPGSPQMVTLSGVGVAPAASFSSPSLNFGTVVVGGGSPMTLVLTNSGNVSMSVTGVSATGDYSPTSNCTTLAPNISCNITVTFSPSATWSRMGLLTVQDSIGVQTIPLSGMGSSGGVPALSTSKLTFGTTLTVGTSATQTVTLSNTGSRSASLQSVVASGDFTQTNNCPAVLQGGANCTLTITFTPTWPAYRTGEVVMTYTDPPMTQSLAVAGSGKAAVTTVGLSPRQFSLTSNQSVQFTATISGVTTTSVNWLVDGIAGGNSTVGTVVNGLYKPPTAAGNHTVTAVSTANTTQTASSSVFVTAYTGTLTQHNDNARTGQNLNETVLSTHNVNSAQFGKLFSYSLDGYVYAQPLYVPNVAIPAQGTHNVIYAVTQHDSAYALDADTKEVLWQVSFINASSGVTTVPSADTGGTDIVPEIGITSTPVIDNNTIYLVAKTKELISGSYQYFQRLHALDITTGAERANSPVVIQPEVSGIGSGTVSGEIAYSALRQNQRPGLLLLNGVLYIASASHNDTAPFHGWVAAYEESSLQPLAASYMSTPNGAEGGIWQGGAGPAVDENGNIYFATSNGTFDVNSGGLDYGDSFIKLNPTSGIATVADSFTPFNQAYMSVHNIDLGSGGVLILPDQPGLFPHLLVGGGKGDTLYLVNRDNMGGYSPTEDQVVQELVNIFPPNAVDAGIRGVSAFFNGTVYTGAIADHLKTYPLSNGLLSTIPFTSSTHTYYYPGATPAISAHGSSQAVAWVLETGPYSTSSPAVLWAFDAANTGFTLYNSNAIASRDAAGPAVKFVVPTVANGKVYVGGEYELDVYGLLP